MAGIDPKYYYLTFGLLIVCTIVGMVVVYRLQRDVNEDDVPPTEKELLGPLEKAYYSGLMTEDEFKRINQSMAKQKDGPLPLARPAKGPLTMIEASEPASTDTNDSNTKIDPEP